MLYFSTSFSLSCHCSPQTQIVLVDGLFECDGVEQILSAASTMETKPYLVITVAQAHSRGSSLHNLMFKHPVRMVTCTPQSEPVNHILPRQLRRQVLELKAVRRLVMPHGVRKDCAYAGLYFVRCDPLQGYVRTALSITVTHH